ncbi:hypothetical protein NMG60_11031638 [Bertholletia excelsa]
MEVSDIGIKLLCKKCPKLKLLDISHLKKLEVLEMMGCGSVDDAGLGFVGKGCPSLQINHDSSYSFNGNISVEGC